MCIGEGAGDTFKPAELTFLETSVDRQLPGYQPCSRDNGSIAWMVLEPCELPDLPRFTICRIDPCIVVQIEASDERRFVSVASLEDAIVIARRAVCEAGARRNLHLAPAMAQ